MRKKDKLLTIITACIPGVGYMYNGLFTKGIEALAIFIFINIFFDLISMNFIGGIIKLLFWGYTFFDSLRIAESIEKGESVSDSNFFSENNNLNLNFSIDGNMSKKNWFYLGWGLIIIGILSIVNKLFVNNAYFVYLKHNIDKYSVPILLIAFGCFLLFKQQKNKGA